MIDPTDAAADHKALMQRAEIEFSIARARAINDYASFEQALLSVFAAVINLDLQKSTIIFMHIAGTRRRFEAIQELIRHSFGSEFDAFFNSVSRHLSGIDRTRNEIVHWIVLHTTTGGKDINPYRDIALHEHPNMFSNEKRYKHDLEYFSEKVEFYRLLLYYFSVFVRTPRESLISHPSKRSWQEIFREPVTYPPPSDHPLA